MENQKEGNWMSVPTFGDWDMKNGAVPDYSMDFSKIREMRKQNKKEISRASLGNEDELVVKGNNGDHHRHVKSSSEDMVDHHRRPLHHAGDHSPTVSEKSIFIFCLLFEFFFAWENGERNKCYQFVINWICPYNECFCLVSDTLQITVSKILTKLERISKITFEFDHCF